MAENLTAEKRGELMLAGCTGGVLGGTGWFLFAYFIWQLPWFWHVTTYESVWWGLLAILLTSIAVTPVIAGFIMIIMASMDLPKERNDAIWLGFIILPFSLIFAWLMFFCVPTYFWWKGMFTEGGGYWALIVPSLILTCIAAAGPLTCLYMLLFGEIEQSYSGEFGSRDLQQGMKGEDVKELQRLLNSVGGQGVEVDGSFGPQTEGAVRDFQEQAELKVDGYVGKETRAALLEPKPPDEGSDDESSTSPSLTIFRDRYYEKEAITVRFDDGPGNPSDWIGIYLSEAPSDEHNHIGWLYLNSSRTYEEGLKQGIITFSEGILEGDYELRFFANNGYELLASSPFRVSGSIEAADSTLTDSEQPVEEKQVDEDEEVPEVEQGGDEAATEVEEQLEAVDSGLRSFIEELKEAKFSSDREKLIKPRLGDSETVSLTVDKIDHTSGFGLSDELRRGRTIIGRTTEGEEVELLIPESMNDAIDVLEKGSDFEANTAISGWNSTRKRIQLEWKQ